MPLLFWTTIFIWGFTEGGEVYISVWEKIAFLIFMLHLYIKVCLFRQTSQLYEDKLTNEA